MSDPRTAESRDEDRDDFDPEAEGYRAFVPAPEARRDIHEIADEWAAQARIVFGVDDQDERGWFSPGAVATLDAARTQATEADLRLLVMTTARDAAVVEADRLREEIAGLQRELQRCEEGPYG